MAADYKILAELEVLLKGQADTKRRLEEVEKGGKKVAESVGNAERSLASFGSKFVAIFSAAVIGGFLRSSLSAFVEIERTFGALGIQLRNLGIDADSNLPRIVSHLKAIESSGGPALRETAAAFQRFIGITKDVNAALAATTLAANISESGLRDTGTAAEAIANIMQGRAAEAAKQLGIELRKQSGELKSNAELIDEVVRNFEGMGDELRDTKNLIDQGNAAWEESKRRVGSAVAAAVGALDSWGLSIKNVVRIIQSLGPIAAKTFFEIASELIGFGRAFAAALDLGKIAKEGVGAYVLGVQTALQEGRASFNAEIKGAEDELDTIWYEAGTSSGEAYNDGLKKVREIAARAQAAKDAEEAAKQAEKAAQEARKLAEKRAEIERAAEDQILSERIKAAEEWSVERERLELQLLGRLHKRALEAARAAKASEATINEAFRQAQENVEDEYAERRAEKDKKELEDRKELRQRALEDLFAAELAAAEENVNLREELHVEELLREMKRILENDELTKTEQEEIENNFQKRIFNLRKRYRKEELDDARREAQTKMLLAANTLQDIAGLMSALFHRNKGIAIAAAIIDTIGASIKAFYNAGGWPWGLIPMLTTLAIGYARVAEMKRQRPVGGGFDDRASDASAYFAGRRWANDMMAKATAGWNDALSGMSGFGAPALSAPGSPAPVAAVPSGGGVNIYGNVYGGDAGLRSLRRELEQAQRRDAARRVR